MNRSNFIHAGYALLIQVGLGTLPYVLGMSWAFWATGALAVGFFIGVEWMQRLRQVVALEGKAWPCVVTPRMALAAFHGWKIDRYGDCGLPLLACAITAYLGGLLT